MKDSIRSPVRAPKDSVNPRNTSYRN
jgi:hypothetical protein